MLDLMSSWVSHLPPEVRYSKVVGHGMNAAELARNQQLDSFFVRNLNEEPDGWAAADQSFDAVVCCVRWAAAPAARGRCTGAGGGWRCAGAARARAAGAARARQRLALCGARRRGRRALPAGAARGGAERAAALLPRRSVQYLQQPERVFAEIHRLLKPGGVCIMAFSNRMFASKAIQVGPLMRSSAGCHSAGLASLPAGA